MLSSSADDPAQYDSPEMNWQVLGAEKNREYFRGLLDSFIPAGSLAGKRVLDIGSGVGHLFPWLRDRGAVAVVGIDPAKSNIAFSKENYPWATSKLSTLQDFANERAGKFDVAICILAFEHMVDLNLAFRSVYNLLEHGGVFYLATTDKNYHSSNDKELRNQGFVSVEIVKDSGGGAIETKTTRDLGDGQRSVMYDILRPTDLLLGAAKNSGLSFVTEKTVLSPTVNPVPMLHLFSFKK